MVSNSFGSWGVRGGSFLLWGLAAASVAYWALKLGTGPAASAPVPVAAQAAAAPDSAAIARLLGASPAAAAPVASVSSRFVLTGVVAGRSHGGVALIAIDGKPPRPVRVGSAIDNGVVLQSVEGRRAVLAASIDGPVLVTLELPLRR